MTNTLFSYNCPCAYSGPLRITSNHTICPKCQIQYPRNENITLFTNMQSNQTRVFDDIYASGHNNIEQKNQTSQRDEYQAHAPSALVYLEQAGYDLSKPIENLSILDAACGSGWTSAAFYTHPNINHCKIHAFDISIQGPKLLGQYLTAESSTNKLELSVQDALEMKFAENSFDVIIGSSILHHFDDYQSYLKGCFNILKPGGKAIFGEPFTIAYGLIYSAMKIASLETKIKHPMIDALYTDVSSRIEHAGDKKILEKYVDKHLFFSEDLMSAGQKAGFSSTKITPLHQLDYLNESIINEIYNEMGVHNKKLRKKTIAYYDVIYGMFKSNASYEATLSPFNYVLFTKN